MSDNSDDKTGAPDDAPAARPVSAGQDDTAPWAPSTDAGIPGDSAEEQPKVRKTAPPLRGGEAPLRRKAVPRPAPVAKPAAVATSAEDDDESETTFEGDRIAKAIARAGIASRRDAEAMIEQGRVTLNGRILTSPAVNVTEADEVTVDGEPLPARERTRLWIFHKPRGLVTTARDPEGRQTVFEALPEDLPRVVAIGRLDINTEGLLLLTNDGGLAKVIAHPDTGWLRRYRVRAHGDTTQAELDKLRKGVTIDGMDYGPVDAVLDRASGDNLWLTLGLREGKNREVKRILEHLGLAVNRLIRLSFGPFQLGDLEVGLVEEIRTKVLKEQLGPGLSEQAGVDFESPVREPIAAFGSPKKDPGQQAKQPARSASAADARERRAQDDERRPARDFQERTFQDRGAGRPPSRGGDRPLQKSAAPARVPTGGNSAGPRRSVWRADEAQVQEDSPRRVKIPRRGADPKAEREAAATRGRERVGAINTGERRVLVERLKATPEEPAAAPHRRDSAFRRDDEGAEARPPRAARPPARPTERPVRTLREADARAARRNEGAERAPRPFDRDGRPPRREDGPPRGNFRDNNGPRSEGGFRRDGGSRTEGEFRHDRGPRQEFGARQEFGTRQQRGPRPDGAERPRAFKSGPPRDGGGFRDRNEGRGERPGGERGGFSAGAGKPAGSRFGKPAGDRPDRGGFKGGDRPGGAKPGGFKAGGFKAGARPAGGKPGGFKAGGGRPGFGRSGGAGGKPGGGRPPRGGSR